MTEYLIVEWQEDHQKRVRKRIQKKGVRTTRPTSYVVRVQNEASRRELLITKVRVKVYER
jgi:hypothetical protein